MREIFWVASPFVLAAAVFVIGLLHRRSRTPRYGTAAEGTYATRNFRVVDGDTAETDIYLGWGFWYTVRLRYAGCNTPETRGLEREYGLAVKALVVDYVNAVNPSEIRVKADTDAKDKYGRVIGVVYLAGVDLSEWLVSNRLAWPTDIEGRIIGPRDLSSLRIPNAK